MVRIVKDDMFENTAPHSVLMHQVNCLGAAGAGVAQEIKNRYSGWFEAYSEHCKQYAPSALLGSFHVYDVPGIDIKICSVFGQTEIGKEHQQTDYNAWKTALPEIVLQLETRHAADDVWTVRAPYRIGCDLGGGDWNVMKDLFEYYAGYSPVDFVFYQHCREC